MQFQRLLLIILMTALLSACDSNKDETNGPIFNLPTHTPHVTVDPERIWTHIHGWGLLDMGKYEQRRDWQATITTVFVDHSMRMRATTHITIAINLDGVRRQDVVVNDEAQTITITLPQAQPIECFLTDIEYYDRSCIGVCGELEDELLEQARDSWQNDDTFQRNLDEAFERGKTEVTSLIEPFAEGYTINIMQEIEPPRPITSGSCYN